MDGRVCRFESCYVDIGVARWFCCLVFFVVMVTWLLEWSLGVWSKLGCNVVFVFEEFFV